MTLLHVPHGYRLASGITPAAFLARLTKVMNPVRDRLDAADFIERAIDSIDQADVALRPRPAAPMDDAFRGWTAEQAGMNRHLVWFDPHSLDVRIGSDPVTGRHHIIAATDRLDYIEALEAMPEVEKYGYQAIIESLPEGITDEEWQERSEAWTRLLPRGRADGMDLWTLRESGDTRTGDVVTALQCSDELLAAYSNMTKRRRAFRRAAEKFASWYSANHGADAMSAVIRAMGMELPALTATIESRLAPLSAELVRTGAGTTAFSDLGQADWDALCAKDHTRRT